MASHGRPIANAYMKKLSAEAVVKKFPQAFIEDPNLTPEIFYDILRSVKFDIKEAQLIVIERVRKSGEFIFPAKLLEDGTPSPSRSFSTSEQGSPNKIHGLEAAGDDNSFHRIFLSLESPIPSNTLETDVLPPRLKRSAPLADSNDDIEQFPRDKKNKSNLSCQYPSLEAVEKSSRSTTTPTSKEDRVCGFLVDTDSDKDDLPRLPPLSSWYIDRAKKDASFSSNGAFHTAESSSRDSEAASVPTRKHPAVIDLISDKEKTEDTDDESTFVKPADTPTKPAKPARRKRSSNPDFDINADYELASDNEELGEVQPGDSSSSFHSPTPKLGIRKERTESKLTRRVLKHRQRFVTKDESDNDFGYESYDESEYEILSSESENEELRDIKPSGNIKRGKVANQNEAVLKHRNQSLATPWLYTLARPFYPKKVDVIENYPHEKGPDSLPDLSKYLEGVRTFAWEQEVPKDIHFDIWGNESDNDNLSQDGYASVTIDGETYLPGDCVMLRGHVDDQPKRGRPKLQSNLTEEDAIGAETDPWYGKIMFFHDVELGSEVAHVQWFEHASATFQGELGCANELFLLSLCSDIEVGSFAGKITVSLKDPDSAGGIVEHDFTQDKEYFCRFHYNPNTHAFTDASTFEYTKSDYHTGPGPCEACNRQAADKEEGSVEILGWSEREDSRMLFQGFHIQDTDYYLHDFVYIFEDEKEVYTICQIIDISARASGYNSKKATIKENKLCIKVSIYARFDDFQKPWFKEIIKGSDPRVRDERRLYYTGIHQSMTVDRLDGKCCVRHREDIEDFNGYKDQDNHFWVDQQVSDILPEDRLRISDLVPLDPEDITYSKHSTIEAETQGLRAENFKIDGNKLAALDLFSGAGGLTVGMELSDVVETRHAVEFSEAACRTYKKNFPDCTIHNADINLMLERAIRRDLDETLEPLHDCHGDLVEDLPPRGTIDFIYGCPCPGYSSANRFQQDEDIKNSLLVVMLSYVDYYRPKYFLLENVRGLLNHRLGATREQKAKVEGGVEKGTVKFILRALTSLGYQVHYALLQAKEHGVPSSRTRVFFWASLPGYPLPKFPQSQNLLGSPPRSDVATWYRDRRSAPHRACTVGDAITDLPKFDWEHPWQENNNAITKDRHYRWMHGISQYEVVAGEDAVGLKCQSYDTEPLSEFQRKMRMGVPVNNLLNHVTQHWKEKITILICEIPMRPGADHRDVTEELRPRFMWHPDTAAQRQKYYPGRCGRLDMEEGFVTCLTNMDPISKNGKVVHPTQHRVLSVVEYSRAMSFPDSFVFALDGSRILDIIRQIGNTVPPFLAKAVGAGLAESVLSKFEDERKRSAALRPSLRKAIKPEQSTSSEVTTKKPFTKGNSFSDAICLD